MKPLMLRVCGLAFALVLLTAATPTQAGQERWWHWWFGDPTEVKWWHWWFGDPAIDARQVADDAKVLRDAKIVADNEGILRFLKSLTPSDQDRTTTAEL